MRHNTWPIATPKAPFPSRADALHEEELFDLGEFEAWGERPEALPVDWTISRTLLERVEDVPFALLSRTDAAQRLASLRPRAEAALRRAQEQFGAHFTGALMFGFTVDFAAPLPRCAEDRSWGFIRMHCGPDETGILAITLLDPSEYRVEEQEERP
jgi:hypothetical protein